MIQIANTLVVIALIVVLTGAAGLAIYLGRLRARLLEIDPDLYYSAGFDTLTMFLVQGAGPEGVQDFLTGREFEHHADAQVRHYASRFMFCRTLFVVAIALIVLSGMLRLVARS